MTSLLGLPRSPLVQWLYQWSPMLCRCAFKSPSELPIPMNLSKFPNLLEPQFALLENTSTTLSGDVCTEPAQGMWSLGGYWSCSHHYHWTYHFPTYNRCLLCCLVFFPCKNRSSVRADVFIWLVTGESSVPARLSDTLYKKLWSEWTSKWIDGLYRSCHVPFVCSPGRMIIDLPRKECE